MNAENTTNSLSLVPLACENKPESITFSDNNNDNKEKKRQSFTLSIKQSSSDFKLTQLTKSKTI